ncbi:hypothetical protein ACIGXI_23330 [Kitasatospora aureofaciens]|uniref:hypothetical protein n=1 Tax=Kitasatospora aureofaciens TaxID=1894 RepID=UPI0037CB5CD6
MEEARRVHALEPVRHQNTIYDVTAPVALCVAVVLGRRAEHRRGVADRVCTLLLGFLAGVAYDSDDACVAAHQWYFEEDFLEGYPAMMAVRVLRPVLFQAVVPFLTAPTPPFARRRCAPSWRSRSTPTWPVTVTAWPAAPDASCSFATHGGVGGRPLTP